jgi:pimeloyl-ACP methyl ester carboxylesterase
VVKATAATRAVGVSLGASVVVALAAGRRDLFERIVVALLPSLDRQSQGDDIELAGQLADAIEANDQIALARLLLEMQPPSARTRSDVRIWARRHAALIGGTGVSDAFRVLPGAPPSVTSEQLGLIDVPVLVLAQRDDPWHPLSAAERLVSVMPNAQLVVSDVPWVWGARPQLRGVITEFLNS